MVWKGIKPKGKHEIQPLNDVTFSFLSITHQPQLDVS